MGDRALAQYARHVRRTAQSRAARGVIALNVTGLAGDVTRTPIRRSVPTPRLSDERNSAGRREGEVCGVFRVFAAKPVPEDVSNGTARSRCAARRHFLISLSKELCDI